MSEEESGEGLPYSFLRTRPVRPSASRIRMIAWNESYLLSVPDDGETRNKEGSIRFACVARAVVGSAKFSVSPVKPSTISTAWLKTLLPLHQPPIQLVVS
jgi:hypothetical protein